MKFGKSYEEKVKASDAQVGKDKVFALFPKFCTNTCRTVWLEYVERVRFKDHPTRTWVHEYYNEIQGE